MLIPRFPGSKRRHWRFFVDETYDSIVEPFAGGGSISVKATEINPWASVFAADANPATWAVWHCWGNLQLHSEVYCHVERLKSVLKDDPGYGWESLKLAYEAANVSEPASLAATTLMVHRLTFGGVVRCNTQGRLNIAASKGQYEALERFHYRFPPIPLGGLTVGHQWEDAIAAFNDIGRGKTLAIVDPPYWLPYQPGTERRGTGAMTPAYPGHLPHAEATLRLTIDSVRALATNPKVHRLIVTNYLSDAVDGAMSAIADGAGYYLQRVDLGLLNGLNKSRTAVVKARDTAWVMTKVRPNVQLGFNL